MCVCVCFLSPLFFPFFLRGEGWGKRVILRQNGPMLDTRRPSMKNEKKKEKDKSTTMIAVTFGNIFLRFTHPSPLMLIT